MDRAQHVADRIIKDPEAPVRADAVPVRPARFPAESVRVVEEGPVRAAVECDLLEQDALGPPRKFRNGALELDFGPFEVKTLKLSLE